MLAFALLAGLLTPQSATHGAMVGGVGPDTAMVWTRADGPCRVQVRYGKGPGETLDLVSAEVAAGEAADFTAKVVLTGLQPATEYRYQVTLTNGGNVQSGPRGRFRTAPLPERAAPFTFAFSADVRDTGSEPMWARIEAHRPDLYLSLGDLPYADEARDLAGYRRANQKVRENQALQDFFRSVPIAPVWDDHEVADDWDAGMDPQRVAAGTRAWREYMPVAEGPVYRSFRWGAGVEVFLLDCRSMRGRNDAPDLPPKSMLGTDQRRWLVEGLAASRATFKLVCTSVPLRAGGAAKDSWLGYQRERDDILAELEGRGVAGVVFLSGDMHWAAVSGHAEGRPEFQVGPLAAALGEPPVVPDRQVCFVAREQSYGLVSFDPASDPPSLTVGIHGANGELHRTVIGAGRPAHVQVDGAAAGVRLVPRSGGLPLTGHGAQVRWLRVPAGPCELRFAAGPTGRPEPLAVQLPAGSRASVATGAPPLPCLLRDDFDVPQAMTVTDTGTRNAPSAWFTSSGMLWQSSAIALDEPRPGDPFAPATFCVRGSREWTDVALRIRWWTAGGGTLALVCRYRGPGDHCRLVWNGRTRTRRLECVTAGRVQVLAEDRAELVTRRWYRCELRAAGNELAAWIDGVPVLTAKGELPAQGAVALATEGNELAAFDDLEVQAPGQEPPAGDASTMLDGWTEPTGGRPGPRWSTGAVLHCAPQPGAEAALLRAEETRDCRATVRARWLAGEIVLLARSSGPGDQYELRWDGSKVVLQRRIGGGKPWVIGSGPAPGKDGLFHDLTLQCAGFRLEAWFDDAPVVREMDGAHVSGRSGLAVSDQGGAEFTGFHVGPPAPPVPVLATVVDEDGACTITASCPNAPGGAYALALWLDRPHGLLPGVPGREPALLVGAAEPRFLLGGARGFTAAFGELDRRGGIAAAFAARRLPALRGQCVLVGGYVLDAEGREVQVVLPRAATIL